jgi:hypothetical protein
MANRQIYQLDPRTISTTDYFPTQDAYGLQEAGNNTIQDIIDLIPVPSTAGLLPAATFNSWTGSAGSRFSGTAAEASYVALQGQGITVNGLSITASVRAVNGKFPTANGNVQVALSATITGNTASLAVSSSGTVTASLADGLIWIVANDGNPANNGLVYIFSSGSVGTWYPIAPLDAAAIDAAYLRLDGTNDPLQGNIDAGGFNITGAGTISATRLTGSLASSYINGPQGTNSVLSASHAVSASYVVGGASAFPYIGEALITGSLRIIAGTGNFGSGSLLASRIGVPTLTAPTLQPVNTAYTNYVWQTNVNNNINWRSFPLVYGAGTSTVAGAYAGALDGLYYEQIVGSGLKIGEAYVSASTTYAPAQYIWRDPNTSTPVDVFNFVYPKPSYRTIISDNSSIGYSAGVENTAMAAVVAANGRNHVLVVSGSMLARDGVSLGTAVSNQHYITGSISVSGSLTVNSGTAITNAGDTYTSTAAVTKVVSLTAAEYSGITPDANTLYVVI